MRLLKTDISATGKLQFEEFSGSQTPQYAILSHRWARQEITLQEANSVGIDMKNGYRKIEAFCRVAKNACFEYAWIDTCCIDKTSSVELSEAINSMYDWYRMADVCYTYLDDVPSRTERAKSGVPFKDIVSSSQWFERGWTLQELIAPSNNIFFDREWECLGGKAELGYILSSRTGIPWSILSGTEGLETISVAQRMSWAAKRKTTRIEDGAYCLMGIFGINMPLLYGEREKAFLRLQEEILRVSDDVSLFAWKSEYGKGLLAPSPAAFLYSGNVVRCGRLNIADNPPTVSSRGIYLEVHFVGVGPGIGLAILDCQDQDNADKSIAIYVEDIFLTRDTSLTMQHFKRILTEELTEIDLQTTQTQIPVRKICVQSGRSSNLQFYLQKPKPEERNTRSHSIMSDKDLKYLNYDHREALLHASARSLGIAWLMMTRPDVETHLKVERNPMALFKAVEKKNDAIFTMLISRGATLDPKKWTEIVRLAIRVGHVPTVKAILEKHLMVARDDRFGEEALEYAASLKNQSVISAILDMKVLPSNGSLQWSIDKGHFFIVQLLLERGASIEEKGELGITPLMQAVIRGHIKIVELLLIKGAEVSTKNVLGETALTFAGKFGRDSISHMLRDYSNGSSKRKK